MLRMMVVTAHPDDEASSFGGSLRLYRERGIETSVICLTPGQAATYRGGAHNDQELGAMRRREFAAACEILKVSRHTPASSPSGHYSKSTPEDDAAARCFIWPLRLNLSSRRRVICSPG